jgi:hypothetical protein
MGLGGGLDPLPVSVTNGPGGEQSIGIVESNFPVVDSSPVRLASWGGRHVDLSSIFLTRLSIFLNFANPFGDFVSCGFGQVNCLLNGLSR